MLMPSLCFGVKDRANEIYKKVEDLKSIRGRSQDAILAACLYIACRQEDKPRTFKGSPLFQMLSSPNNARLNIDWGDCCGTLFWQWMGNYWEG